MDFYCPKCTHILKRDMRLKVNKGARKIRSFCEKAGQFVYLRPVKKGEGMKRLVLFLLCLISFSCFGATIDKIGIHYETEPSSDGYSYVSMYPDKCIYRAEITTEDVKYLIGMFKRAKRQRLIREIEHRARELEGLQRGDM